MTSTFNDGTDDYVPILVEGFESTSESQSIVRKAPFDGTVSVVLRPSPLGSGHLRALWDSSADAKAMKLALDAGSVWTFAETGHPSLDMSFVVDGSARVEKENRASVVWWTLFDYQEVTP